MGGCSLCRLARISMGWHGILYITLRVLGEVCVGQSLRHGLWHGGLQKRVLARSKAAWVVLVGGW